MRKTRDYDAELRALGDKARAIKAKKVQQLGELVIATGADALDLDVLVGGLIHIVGEAEGKGTQEAFREDGIAFFQGRGRKAGRRAGGNTESGSQAGASETQT